MLPASMYYARSPLRPSSTRTSTRSRTPSCCLTRESLSFVRLSLSASLTIRTLSAAEGPKKCKLRVAASPSRPPTATCAARGSARARGWCREHRGGCRKPLEMLKS